MAVHLNRDYAQQDASDSFAQPYILACFLRFVLGYSIVGQTNYDLTSLVVASGTSAPDLAGINFTPDTYAVSVPAGSHVVSLLDVGKLLVLRSTTNPLFNSGVFLITGVDTVNNRFVIDWRSLDSPPAEAGGATGMSWWLLAADSSAPRNTTGNGGTGYLGNGSATCSRIILQSPHASGWQVRLCCEPEAAFGKAPNVVWSISVGLGGNSAGDWAGSPLQCTHVNLVNNSPPTSVRYMWQVGAGVFDTPYPFRMTFVGDDTGQALVGVLRGASGSQLVGFGRPDNIPGTTPAGAQELFCIGSSTSRGHGEFLTCTFSGGGGDSGYGPCGNAVGASGVIPCFSSAWTYENSTHSTPNVGPFWNANAGDSPYISALELLQVDLVAGVVKYPQGTNISPNQSAQFEPRILGTWPYVRQGRANFSAWALTSDSAWYHAAGDVYFPWNGPGVLS